MSTGVAPLGLREAAFVRRLDAQIAECLHDETFGVTALAFALGLSERQLRRRVQEVTGESPGDRLRRARVEAGAALLATGEATVEQAARRVGYRGAEGFRRAFVSVWGCQPSDVAAGRAPGAGRPADASGGPQTAVLDVAAGMAVPMSGLSGRVPRTLNAHRRGQPAPLTSLTAP